MFDNSHTFKRFSAGSSRAFSVNLGHVPHLEPEPDNRRGKLVAVALAVLLHLGFFLLQVPAGELEPRRVGPKKAAYVVKQVRFQPPPPPRSQEIPKPRQKRKIIPIPDPTPQEPEPIRVAEIEVPEFELAVDDAVFGIPEGPPGEGIVGGAPRRLGGEIAPPVKTYYPQPRYTEEGRLARVQGVVILEAVIDAEGRVHNVKVLKGLPLGLSESAVETAREWTFKPAMLNGQPVPVYLNLTIRFSLQ